jgi:RNA polymerase sigma factor (sigma-70 family)
MADLEGQRVGSRRLSGLDDRRLAALVARGDETAFEGLYDRHWRSLLAFCRHVLGDRQDAEDVLQQTFLRAHRALEARRVPDSVRPWLFTIARNRCRTLLAACRDTVMAPEDLEPACDGLADDARRRAELDELIRDLAGLPEDQREALVLFVVGGLSQADVASVIGCAPGKVKALVFQARETMVAERQARDIPCEEIQAQLDVGRGGVLRRAPLRRHLRQCEPCARYRDSGGIANRPTSGVAPGSYPA